VGFHRVALGVLSAVTLVGAASPASAGLLDGWWGCGCGGPGYYVAPPFVETDPGIIYAARYRFGPPPVAYAPPYAYGPPPRPWRHYPRRYY
jgi:hypothetical protein